MQETVGVYQEDGFSCRPGPAIIYGFERGGALQQLCESLGITHHASQLSPSFQVALPDKRITIFAEQAEMLEELRREFRAEVNSIARFYRDLRKLAQKEGKSRFSAFLSGIRRAQPFIGRYRFSSEFISFLDVQSRYFFSSPLADLFLHQLIALCDSVPFTLQGGIGSLSEQLLDATLKKGGTVQYGVPLSGISLKANMLSWAEGGLESDSILLNIAARPARPFLCLGLRSEVIPVGMLNHVLCLPDYADPARFYTLSLSPKEDPEAAPPGMRTMTVETSDGFPVLNMHDRLALAARVMPFLDEFIVVREDRTPVSRAFTLPAGIHLKSAARNQKLLQRTSLKGVSVLFDRPNAAATASAARRLVDTIR